jgi:acyl transferase domain-containing protein
MIQVPTTVETWNGKEVRRASVNNFGFGGSNAHVIIDDARSYLATHGLKGACQTVDAALSGLGHTEFNFPKHGTHNRSRIFVISAFDEASGARQVEALREHLKRLPEAHPVNFLNDLAFTLGERRTVLPWRAAIVAKSASQLKKILSSECITFSKSLKAISIGFVFTGQGAQWRGMGRELIAVYPAFHESLVSADEQLKIFGASWSLLGMFLRCFMC